jgi:hypothetical protein
MGPGIFVWGGAVRSGCVGATKPGPCRRDSISVSLRSAGFVAHKTIAEMGCEKVNRGEDIETQL